MKYIFLLMLFLSSFVLAEEFKGKTVIFTFKENDVKVKENFQGGLEQYDIEFPIAKEFNVKSIYVTNHITKVKRSDLKKYFNETLEQVVIPVDKKTEKQIYKKNKRISLGDFRGYEFSYLKTRKDGKSSELQVYLCLEKDGVMWDFQCHSSDPKDLEGFREFVKAIKFIKKK